MSREEFKELRKRLGMTQADLAEALGYGARTRISELESGARAITPQTAAAMRNLVALREGVRPR